MRNRLAEDRVLVLAPTAVDASITKSVLGEAGLRAEAHASFDTLIESMRENAGALLLTEMAVIEDGAAALVNALKRQPRWSDIPVILLAGGGTDSAAAVMMLETLGNVTVLERPTHVVTLVSTLRSAIKARRRQFELRDRILALEQAEENVDNSERQFRQLVETAMEGIWQVDLNGHTTYVNQRLCDMLGVTPEDIMSAPAESYFHPDDAGRFAWRIANRGEPAGDTDEWRLRRADGSYLCVLSSATPVLDAAGNIVGAFAMMTDITDRKATEEALKDSTKRKDEFIAVLAHELRNPLAPIRSSLQILRFTDDPKNGATPVLDMLDRQVTHMVHLVDELLEISRISTGVIELHKTDVTLESIVQTAVEAASPHIRAASHNLSVSLPPSRVVLHVDAVRMAQVLTNLLNNAAKYTEREGCIWLTARVNAAPGGESQVEVSVRDTGVGIEPENLSKVFEMFSQIDREVGRAHHGLGIGLALAQNLVQLHNGTILARSEGPGKGSEFIFRLPLPTTAHLLEGTNLAARASTGRNKSLSEHSILVVDDNADAADSIAALLRGSGARVDVTYDGEHALQSWRAKDYDTVVLDIGMPGMDGYELATHIRAEEHGVKPVLIALTGWGQSDDRMRTREAGINHHLVKPIEFNTLQRLLAEGPGEGAER